MANADEPVRPHGYRAVWRWHFYAALWTAPLLIVLTLSGAIYLFDREIDAWWNRSVQTLAPAPGLAALPLERQEAIVKAAHPGATVLRVRLPFTADEATIWTVRQAEGSAQDVFLDAGRGRITGTADPALQPTNLVRKVHGTFFAGEIGSHVVEIVACWTLVMMATGVWLWWPRKWKVRGVFVPRLSAGGRRRWRDLHAIPSIFLAGFVILLVLTGLPWSAFWGAQFAKLGEVVPFIAPSPNFHAPPEADGRPAADPHAMHKMMAMPPADPKLPWTIRHSAMPQGSGSGPIGIARVEALLPLLDRAHFGEGVRIIYPQGPKGVFTVSYVPDKAEGQRTLYMDPGTGRVLGNVAWADYSPVAKAVEWGVMTHMGRQYGLANQLANLAVCLMLVGSVSAGLVLWWRRRPQGELGAPTLQPGDRMPVGVKVLLAVLAVLFPLVGATMLPALAWGRLRR
ncbi:PepSY domain-containing protein [Novosphingobium sp.]|uniref:PepSY-associated TM helix domain-containing protein n=1 Tax=Novosphingobium sp. TaxID=1874826 RepID=UPI00261461A3|nr:PepSY domain-containing protein [Novosphingobium sp.]